MKKQYLIAGVILVVISAAAFFLLGKPAAKQTESGTSTTEQQVQLPEGEVVAEVIMGEEGYEPANITLKVGQAIRFVNASSTNRWPASNLHPSHDIYPEFDPQRELEPGESWTFTFHNKGFWRMHDHLLPYMKGSVTVE